MNYEINEKKFSAKVTRVKPVCLDEYFKEISDGDYTTVGDWHNRFTISIKTESGQKSFHFYGSINDFNNHKNELSESDLIWAVYCIFLDATSYINAVDILDFRNEFGYKDSKETRRVYNACKKQANNLNGLGFSDDDIFEMCNALRDLQSTK